MKHLAIPDSKVTNEHHNWPDYVIKATAGSEEEVLKESIKYY